MLLKEIEGNCSNKKKTIRTTSKNSTIVPKFTGRILQVYNGKIFVNIKIVEEMINHKLGEFINTRKQFFYKKKNK